MHGPYRYVSLAAESFLALTKSAVGDQGEKVQSAHQSSAEESDNNRRGTIISSMRTVFDIFAQILRNLWAHKLRSFLTMFGIAWGVGSLLLLVGVGEGFRSGNKRELAEFGRDIMFLFPGRAPAVKGNMNSARSYLLTYRDYLDIRQLAYVRNACPLISRTDLHEVSEFANGSGEILG